MTQLAEAPPANGESSALAKVQWRGAELIVNRDESQFANMLDTGRFTQVYKLAELFASSQLVPQHFQGKAADCFIGIQMALRLGVDPFMFLQNTYVVYGRPGMEAKLAIALINSSGTFNDPLDYEIEGESPTDQNYRVRAFAVRKHTNKTVFGPWIDWKIVKAEKWDSKEGSKWRSIPQLMFQYRAATWFGRLHCPERLMGMQTVDELADVGALPVISSVTVDRPRGTSALIDKLKAREIQDGPAGISENADTSAVAARNEQTTGTASGGASDLVQEAEQESHDAPIDPLLEAYEQDVDARGKTLLALVKKTTAGKVNTMRDVQGFLFKYAQAHNTTVEKLLPESWIEIHRAIDKGKFDFSKGAILE